MTKNYIPISSSDDLQANLGADLTRLSILNFRATWAEPCKQMDAVAKQLAEKHPKALFLEIEAEALPEISESFDVESVPFFVILRGHTLLDQISGAQALQLSKSIEKHLYMSSTQPQSTTNKAPAAPPARDGAAASSDEEEETKFNQPAPPENETEEELNERCKKIMNAYKVVLFMKGNPSRPQCGFSKQTVALLNEQKVAYQTYDVLQDEGVRSQMKTLNDWPTFPQVIVNGELIGGLDILKEMIASGELKEVLEESAEN